jgi:hypothetical protein
MELEHVAGGLLMKDLIRDEEKPDSLFLQEEGKKSLRAFLP